MTLKKTKIESAPPRRTKHEEKIPTKETKQSLFQLFCRIDDIKNNTEYC